MNQLQFIEQIKGIAQNGLFYATNEYDKLRYQSLLDLVYQNYASITNIEIDKVKEIFLTEQGIPSPKVGVNAAIFLENKLIITQRMDDNQWELPGGWAELNESPREVIIREIKEETSITIQALDIIDVISRKPGDFNQTYTSYHILINSKILAGEYKASIESKSMKLISKNEVNSIEWHRDHQLMAEKAFEFQI